MKVETTVNFPTNLNVGPRDVPALLVTYEPIVKIFYAFLCFNITRICDLHHKCIFRPKPITDSGASRSPFRGKPITDSGASRSPFRAKPITFGPRADVGFSPRPPAG